MCVYDKTSKIMCNVYICISKNTKFKNNISISLIS